MRRVWTGPGALWRMGAEGAVAAAAQLVVACGLDGGGR